MPEVFYSIHQEIVRATELSRNNHHMQGLSSHYLKVEIQKEVFEGFPGENLLEGTIFGVEYEVKENLKREFIVYIDSFHLS